VGDLNSLNLRESIKQRNFDVVLCNDVLEHLYDATPLLQHAHHLLRPGGLFIGSIPNLTHIGVVQELISGDFAYRKIGLLDDSHIRILTRSSIISLLTNSGFRLDSLDRVAQPLALTEFGQRDNSHLGPIIEDYILTRNIEAETYHFIVSALRSEERTEALQAANAEFERSNLENFKSSLTVQGIRRKRLAQLEYFDYWSGRPFLRNWLKSFLRKPNPNNGSSSES
jgi:SAM-dependent methyltransferase